ncbi:MAG: glycoside hydrolase family 73 protein [Limosilactobacillus pontis]|uniref:Gametolysin n=1 Tax=Limosilactobacillus pontis TaxID=35787 RepID=A0A2J6NQB3_9LACO|nr:glucosaminidase domain-containing protein [Limosilactobacillus pontis]PMB83512.1 gametolysin [Limosilactobacillus pontis]
MNKPILISTVAALMMTHSGMVVAASAMTDPAQEAANAIINQQSIDEQDIRQRGESYAAAFLTAFRRLSIDYQQAFEQGVADGRLGQQRTVTGAVAAVAYQRGLARGQLLQGAADATSDDTTRTMEPTLPDDNIGQVTQATDEDTTNTETSATGNPDQEDYAIQVPTNSQRAFINRLATAAQQVGTEYDLYPSVIIAQAALESNWGTSRLGRAPFHNLFGVKGYFAGQTTNQPTSEYLGGRQLLVVDNFRRYQSDAAALHDYAETLQAPLYRGVHRQYAATYRQATHALQGRYATDPQYEQKLNRLIDGFQLTRYDHRPRHAAADHTAPVKVKVADDRVSQLDRSTKPLHRDRQHRNFSTVVSVIGGLGSAGLIEIGRRLFLK